MSGAVATAVIASAVIGVAGAVYSAEASKSAQKKATNAQLEAQRKAKEEANRVASESRPTELGATLQVGGTTTVGSNLGSTADFLIPKANALGSTGTSGLGFSI